MWVKHVPRGGTAMHSWYRKNCCGRCGEGHSVCKLCKAAAPFHVGHTHVQLERVARQWAAASIPRLHHAILAASCIKPAQQRLQCPMLPNNIHHCFILTVHSQTFGSSRSSEPRKRLAALKIPGFWAKAPAREARSKRWPYGDSTGSVRSWPSNAQDLD